MPVEDDVTMDDKTAVMVCGHGSRDAEAIAEYACPGSGRHGARMGPGKRAVNRLTAGSRPRSAAELALLEGRQA